MSSEERMRIYKERYAGGSGNKPRTTPSREAAGQPAAKKPGLLDRIKSLFKKDKD